jgi:D-sedoheptulose 7-phosphate isomerase
VTDAIVNCYLNEGKVLFCGNGGSAADAQHLAAELSGRFYYDRAPLNAEALHVNTSFLTAVGNDYSFDEVYARMVYAAGKPGDILVALSTSGNSPNILKAAAAAREKGLIVVGMTGKSGGKLNPLCDLLLNIPSTDTPRIQESHITLGHIICELVESELFPR